MHVRAASRSRLGVTNLWTTDAGTFPVLICAGVAAVACVSTAVHAIIKSPDVRIDKDRRRNALSFTAEDGNTWRMKRFSIANSNRNPINQSHHFDPLFEKEENKGVSR